MTGYVENLAEKDAFAVGVTATFYGPDGKVVAASHSTLSESVPRSGGKRFFDLRIEDMDRSRIASIQTYRLYAQSYEYNMIPEFPSPLLVSGFALTTISLIVRASHRSKRKERE